MTFFCFGKRGGGGDGGKEILLRCFMLEELETNTGLIGQLHRAYM